MLWFAIRRILWSIPVLIIASILVFVAMRATTDPGVLVGPGITSEDIQRFREEMGLDKSATEQYLGWAGRFVRGDFGESLKTRQPVWPELSKAMWNSIQLGVASFLLTLVVGVTIGTISALKHNSWFDHTATGSSFVALSWPPFFFGLVLQIIVGVWLAGVVDIPILNGTRFPFWSVERAKALILPMLTVAVQGIAVYSRYMRSGMLDVLSSDYLRTARAKGVKERRVVVRHAMRNALIPLTTLSALQVGSILGGLIITEQVFEWHGMGWYFLRAFGEGDYFRVLPWAMIVVGSVIVFNLIADLVYGLLDPRIRYG